MNGACCETLCRLPYRGRGRYTEDIKAQFLSWHCKVYMKNLMFMLSGIGVGMATTKVVVLFFSHWRHNERDGFSNHRRLDCLLNRSSTQIKENIGEFPSQRPVTRKMLPFDDVILSCLCVQPHLLEHKKSNIFQVQSVTKSSSKWRHLSFRESYIS